MTPMDVNHSREAFIPFRRADIINLCLKDGRLDAESSESFRSFCEILAAFFHFQFHSDLEEIKDNFLVFNPAPEVKPLYEPSLAEYGQMEEKVIKAFKRILERANYIPMPDEMIQEALVSRSLIALKTEVDFNDFDQLLCYYRGDCSTTLPAKKLWFWKTEQRVNILKRLVLLIKFKGKGYFRAKQGRNGKSATLPFIPGKMYVYFYKNIPKLDLDLLFPNIRTRMTWRDRLMLVVPAIAAAIPVVLKTLPNLLLLIAAIFLAVDAYPIIQSINVEEEQARNVMPVLIATLTLVIALGGFAFKQYNQYKNKKIKFQKERNRYAIF